MLIDLAPWVAAAVGLVLLVDDLVFAPRRAIARQPTPGAIRSLRWVMLAASIGTLYWMFRSHVIDFSLVLVLASAFTGLIWLIDRALLRSRREALAALTGPAAAPPAEPVTVEYARSFFPVILLVLVIRSFLFEPFRIPSDSMMPTLLNGDFIFVNKFAYGLRLPVANSKVVDIGSPHRGDVVVFRMPSDPRTNYIKRLVGLPGDRVEVRERRVYVNGEVLPLTFTGVYEGRNHDNARIGSERLGEVEHNVLYLPGSPGRDFSGFLRHLGSVAFFNDLSRHGARVDVEAWLRTWHEQARIYQEQSKKYWLYR